MLYFILGYCTGMIVMFLLTLMLSTYTHRGEEERREKIK